MNCLNKNAGSVSISMREFLEYKKLLELFKFLKEAKKEYDKEYYGYNL